MGTVGETRFALTKIEVDMLYEAYTRRKLIRKYGNRIVPLSGRNRNDEQIAVMFNGTGMTIRTKKKNGVMTLTTFDSRGFQIEEKEDGRWR